MSETTTVTETGIETNTITGSAADTATNQTEQPTQQTEKTFSKKEYDDMALKQYNAGLINAMKEAGFTDFDEKNFKKSLSSFKKWQDDQKTAEQLQKEALEAARLQAKEAQSELSKYKQYETVRKVGIDETFVGYVSYEVSALSAAKNISFDDAFTEFLAANQGKYVRQAHTEQQETRRVTASTSADKQTDQKPEMAMNFIGVRPKK